MSATYIKEDLPELESPQPEKLDIEPPPDGGLLAWSQVTVFFFGTWNSWGLVNTFGVYQEYYQQNLLQDIPPGTISWIGALQGSLVFLFALIIGPLIDRGFVKQLLFIGAILQGFAYMMMSLSTKYYQLLLTQGVCSGLASSICFCCGITLLSSWFRKRRGIAVGLGATGAAFGGVIYSILARQMIKIHGFAWSARILGFIAFGTEFVAFLVAKRRLPPRKTGAFIDFEAYTILEVTAISWAYLLANGGIYVFYFYIQTYALNHLTHTDYDLMIYTTAILNSGSVPGRIIPNYLADIYGPVTIFTISVIATMILTWFWLMAESEAAVLIIAWFYGFFTGPVVSLVSPAVATMTPDLTKLGTRLSFCFLHGGIGFLIGPPLAGIMIRVHAWKYGQIYAGCLVTLACVAGLISRWKVLKGKWKGFA